MCFLKIKKQQKSYSLPLFLSDKVEIVPSGTHDYSFMCTLPPDLPSSFIGSFGNIKYKANVVICISLWPDKKFSEKFTVFKPVNLNDFPSLQVCLSLCRHQINLFIRFFSLYFFASLKYLVAKYKKFVFQLVYPPVDTLMVKVLMWK